MKDLFNKLQEWHDATGVKTADTPRMLPVDRYNLRHELMKEENFEYILAENEVEVADALGDMLYILIGTILEHGMQNKIEDIFNEIHRSNMTKVVDGKVLRRQDGKILKPGTYEAPNLKKILEQ